MDEPLDKLIEDIIKLTNASGLEDSEICFALTEALAQAIQNDAEHDGRVMTGSLGLAIAQLVGSTGIAQALDDIDETTH